VFMDYMSLFPSASRNMPRFSMLAEAVLSQVNDLQAVIAALPAAFSVSGAVGAQLDAVGAAAGLSRPDGMNDADYRACLQARLLLYTWDGANDSAREILSRAFPGSLVLDNCDGTVTVTHLPAHAADRGLCPVPAGVRTIVL